MADVGAQGTTFTFGAAVSGVQSISVNDGGGEIDITNLSSTEREFLSSFGSTEVTVTVFGGSTIARGDTGAISVAWNDGTTDSVSSAICISRRRSGSAGDAITTTLTFKPTPA